MILSGNFQSSRHLALFNFTQPQTLASPLGLQVDGHHMDLHKLHSALLSQGLVK